MKRIVWCWRRRLLKKRVALQEFILDGASLTGADIGAAGGLQPHWWNFEGAANLYLFEPHPEAARSLRKLCDMSPYARRFHIEEVGVAEGSGTRTLYVLNSPTGSSLLPIDSTSEFAKPGNNYVHPIRKTEVQVRNLSEVMEERGVANIDVLKLDVQGAELEVLRGLSAAMAEGLILLETEINIAGGVIKNSSPYEGAPSWIDIDRFASTVGLRLLDIGVSRSYRSLNGDHDWYQREVFGVYRNSPGISASAWEVDAVYVRDYRRLIENSDAIGLRKLVVALGVYRFFSEAHFIVDEAKASGVIAATEADAICGAIVEWHRLVAKRWWHGRGRLFGMARRVLARAGFSQLRRWKQFMWFDYPSG